MELKAQAQTNTSTVADPLPRNRDANYLILPAYIDEKDELDSYLLPFERYAKNAKWEKNTRAIKLGALFTGGAMDVRWRC